MLSVMIVLPINDSLTPAQTRLGYCHHDTKVKKKHTAFLSEVDHVVCLVSCALGRWNSTIPIN